MPGNVQRLRRSDTPAAMQVLREAFATHPMLPPGTPPEKTERLMSLMMNSFGVHETAALHGIHRDEKLACVALTLANGTEPKGLALAWFLARLCFILGWGLIRDFSRAMSSQPRYDQPYLELMLLGTLPGHHGQGLGRNMLRFVYDLADSGGYRGVTLAVAKDTPAHRLYAKEGFVEVAEVSMRNLTLVHMRRDNHPDA